MRVLITGASSGIGEAAARVWAAQGAQVALFARRRDRLDALAQEIGPQAKVLVGDVTHRADLDQTFATLASAWGGVDVVVANAGFGVSGTIAELNAADFERQLAVNFYGVLHTAQAALPFLRASKGTLVVVGSVMSYLSLPGTAPYGVSKFAVRALVDSLRAEEKDIHVLLVCPGFIQTEIRQVDNQGLYKKERKDFVPSWLMMPAPEAARQMVRAVARRKREVVITWHGKIFVWLERFFPGLVAFLVARMPVRKAKQ